MFANDSDSFTIDDLNAYLAFAAIAQMNAQTWSRGRIGTSGFESADNYILQAVSETLDFFILEYLRVNEVACGGP